MHSINFYNFEETGKGRSKKSTGKTTKTVQNEYLNSQLAAAAYEKSSIIVTG